MSNFSPSFVPCFTSEEDFENAYKSTEFWTDKDFYETYSKYTSALVIVANSAKIFILKNYNKITDWSGLELKITHGLTRKSTEFFNYDNHWPIKPKENQSEALKKLNKISKVPSVISKFEERWEKQDKERHNPVVSLTNVVLDPTDSDFSVTINGIDFYWIQDEECIEIANYIEQQLKIIKNE